MFLIISIDAREKHESTQYLRLNLHYRMLAKHIYELMSDLGGT